MRGIGVPCKSIVPALNVTLIVESCHTYSPVLGILRGDASRGADSLAETWNGCRAAPCSCQLLPVTVVCGSRKLSSPCPNHQQSWGVVILNNSHSNCAKARQRRHHRLPRHSMGCHGLLHGHTAYTSNHIPLSQRGLWHSVAFIQEPGFQSLRPDDLQGIWDRSPSEARRQQKSSRPLLPQKVYSSHHLTRVR